MQFVDQISIASDVDSSSGRDRRLLFSLLDGMRMVFEDAFTDDNESEDPDQVGAIDLLLSFTTRLKGKLLWRGEDEEESQTEKRKKKVDVLLKKVIDLFPMKSHIIIPSSTTSISTS
jgi:hypothetical protein